MDCTFGGNLSLDWRGVAGSSFEVAPALSTKWVGRSMKIGAVPSSGLSVGFSVASARRRSVGEINWTYVFQHHRQHFQLILLNLTV